MEYENNSRPTKKRSLVDTYFAAVSTPKQNLSPLVSSSISSSIKKNHTNTNTNTNDSIVSVTTGSGSGSSSSTGGTILSYKTLLFHQQQEIETLQSELEHERTIRSINEKKLNQSIDRLERKYSISIEEVSQSKELLDQQQNESTKLIGQLRDAKNNAQKRIRQLEIEISDMSVQLSTVTNHDTDTVTVWKRKYEQSVQQIQYYKQNEQTYKEQIQSIKNEFTKYKTLQEKEEKKQIQQELDTMNKNIIVDETGTGTKSTSSTSPYYDSVEVRNVRIQLAESERMYRQMQRSYDDVSNKYRDTVIKYEQAQVQAKRCIMIQKRYDTLSKDYEVMKAQVHQWNLFQKQLQRLGITSNILSSRRHYNTTTSSKDNDDNDTNFLSSPPDIQSVMQVIEDLKNEATIEHDKVKTMERTINENQITIESIQNECSLLKSSKLGLVTEIRSVQNQLYTAQQTNERTQALVSFHQKEADNLRKLLSTIDDPSEVDGMMTKTSTTATKTSVDDTTTWIRKYRTVQTLLNASQEKVSILEKQINQLKQELVDTSTTSIKYQNEIDSIKLKYDKLREALMNEKNKVVLAEQRAITAEQLAGSGQYNPTITRVLHLSETPLIIALKEEIDVLKRQVEQYTKHNQRQQGEEFATPSTRPNDRSGGTATSTTTTAGSAGANSIATTVTTTTSTTTGSMINPDKLTQRLKENFKEQIALFREGVYLLTGFKVDMITTGPVSSTDRPTFRIRSVYAEREDDHLLFQWPDTKTTTTTKTTKKKDTKNNKDDNSDNTDSDNENDTTVKSLDLLNTALAQVLSTTPAYQYMTNYNSIPAFLANVQLNLFEQQTHIVSIRSM